MPTSLLCLSVFCLLAVTPTLAQVKLVADINPGEDYSAPTELIVYNDQLFFAANDGVHGRELWYFDTASGLAELAADIHPEYGSAPSSLTVFDDQLFFRANDESEVYRLWYYDSATGQASVAADIEPFTEFTVYNDKLFFPVGVAPHSLAYYDTTKGELFLVGASTAFHGPEHFAVYDGRLFFRASDSPVLGDKELWSYDDLTGTAKPVANINPTGDSDPSGLTVYDGRLYFAARDHDWNEELWYYDAATDEVGLAAEIYPGEAVGSEPHNLTVYDDRLFFSASGSGPFDSELWTYDSSTGEASLVYDTPFTGEMIPFDDRLFFRANHNGQDLFVYDAATDVVSLVAEDLTPLHFAVLDNRLFFSGDLPGAGPFPRPFGRELWAYSPIATDTEPEGPLGAASLSPVYPNPTSMSASFALTLTERQHVRIVVLDLLGREVDRVFNGALSAGTNTFEVEPALLSTGLYIVHVRGESFSETRRLTVVK